MPVAHGQFRGGIEVGDIAYVGFEDEIYTVESDGQIKYFADLPGRDKLFFARNQNLTPDVVIVGDAGAFSVSGSSLIAFADPDVGSPLGVTYHDGWFFFWYSNGDVLASALNGVTINTLDAANAASNADGLLQCWPYNGQLYLGGAKTIEVWGYPVNNAGFPLTRVGYHITPGLIAEHCVAGFQPEFGLPPIYIASDNTVRWLQGYQALKISTPDLDRLITDVDDKTTLECMAYRVSGTAFWQVSCADWTWVFNCDRPGWFERVSEGSTRSRITGGSFYAFGRWLVGDMNDPLLQEITDNVATEGRDAAAITATIISPSMKAFPNRVRCARADFDFVVPGLHLDTWSAFQADAFQLNAFQYVQAGSVDISWSDDGGATFSNPYTRSLGDSTSDTIKRVTVLNTGYSKPIGRNWKIECSDPVDFALLGGDMESEIRRK